MTGIDPNAYSSEDLELIFWGIGAHFGEAAVQSRRADRVGYVRHEPDDRVARGYRSSGELVLHTDSRPIIALMCVSSAERGGSSRLASATTIHNVLRRERPDLLAPLYRGYSYFSAEIDSILPAIPVFSTVEDSLSCYFLRIICARPRASAARAFRTISRRRSSSSKRSRTDRTSVSTSCCSRAKF